MAAILIFSALGFLVLTLYAAGNCFRSSVLAASLVWGAFITLTTETLSLAQLITFPGVFSVWILLNIVLLNIALRRKIFPKTRLRAIQSGWQSFPGFEQFLLGCVGIILMVTGAIAIAAPPNNWDSMSYVMPRIIHWIQNRSVEHYPAHYTSQLYNGPWADFASLHLQVLSHGDHLANIIQWMSLFGCLIGVSLITKQLGGNLRAQIFAAAFCATIPSGILHASNSKNTIVIAYWLICFVYYSIEIIQSRPSWILVIAASTSLSLAVLTKGTAYIYALPFLIWLGWVTFQAFRIKYLSYLTGASTVFLTINLGHYLRNFWVFGSPNSTYPYNWGNETYTISAFISNLTKNISLHIVPPFFDWDWLDQWVIEFHKFLHISPLDPKLNLFLGGYHPTEFTAHGLATFEDTASNPFHFWLIIASIFIIFNGKNTKKEKILTAYLVSAITSFTLFCLLIKWQIWHSRLHLPIFILICPILGIIISKSHQKFASALMLIFLLVATPCLFLNETRLIASSQNVFNTERKIQYFAAQSSLAIDYTSLANLLAQKSCFEIGLVQRPDAWEYPLWMLLDQKNRQSLRFENVNVENPSKSLSQDPKYRNFRPCAIVKLGLPSTQQLTVSGSIYKADAWQPQYQTEQIQVFFKS
jgi:hypothetical protein